MAHGWGGGPERGGKRGWKQQRGPAVGRALGEERFQAQVTVLAELSSQSEETIKEKLEYKPTWAVLDEYKIDFKTYRSKMQEKMREVITSTAADGKIDDTQKNFMLERLDSTPDTGVGGRRGWGFAGRGFAGGPCW